MSISAHTILGFLSILVLLLTIRNVMRLCGQRNVAGHAIQAITKYSYATSARNNAQQAQATILLGYNPNQQLFSTPMHRLVTALFLLGFGWALSGCQPPLPVAVADPPAKVPTAALLLDSTAFAKGWQEGTLNNDDDYLDDDIETLSRQWAHENPFFNVVTERITRYPTVDDARSLLDGLVESDRIGDTPDRRRIGYDNRIADKQVMQCAYHRPPPNSLIRDAAFCRAYAQYGTYVVQVVGYIDDHTMSYADFERLLQAIDAKMTIITNEHAAQHGVPVRPLRARDRAFFDAIS